VHDPVDDLGGEGFALGDVLRVLLRVGLEVRVDDADRGQRARVGVGEELRGLAQVPQAPAQPERVQVGGERQVADGPVGWWARNAWPFGRKLTTSGVPSGPSGRPSPRSVSMPR
jgi:hypothetical protein